MRTIVIGLGNPVRSDDAVGLHVAREVRERLGETGLADVEELWAGGLRLVEAMSGYDRAVVVDASVTEGGSPGTVRAFPLSDLGPCRTVACMHDTSFPVALELWRRAGEPTPSDIRIVGVEALNTITLSEQLTEPVARAVPEAVRAVLHAIGLPQGG